MQQETAPSVQLRSEYLPPGRNLLLPKWDRVLPHPLLAANVHYKTLWYDHDNNSCCRQTQTLSSDHLKLYATGAKVAAVGIYSPT